MWNYRVLKHDDGYLALHEVYYNKDGEIVLHSAEAMAPGGETLEELRQDLLSMAAALSKPVLVKSEIVFAAPDWEEEE
jgi:hypothetical protein